ncbi:ORF6N domain-containing protein [Vallitalea guaymasensis]|uniref:ORF6N domain-containing protein n=1 Tax=Vallitalea guaymasensis TaxID=1185412 RepID=UPI000DE558ED|nr:ORF6N domain-containing protein [Vallitalea guaymasensis]
MNNLTVIEHRKQRILTTKQLAEVYKANTQNIKDNFNNHKSRFTEGKHYYCLTGEDLRIFKREVDDIDLVPNNVNKLYLWTEKGALRHAKILDTNKAWEVYEELEDTYFRVRQAQIETSKLSPELQMFKQIFDGVAKVELQNKQLKADLQDMREVIIINPKEEWRVMTQKLLNKISNKIGDYKTPKTKAYEALEARGKCKLKIRLDNLRGRALSNGMARSKADSLNYLDVIANDTRLKEIYITIVKEMAIKYGVA